MQQVGLTVRSFASQSNWRTQPVCPENHRTCGMHQPRNRTINRERLQKKSTNSLAPFLAQTRRLLLRSRGSAECRAPVGINHQAMTRGQVQMFPDLRRRQTAYRCRFDR